VFDIGEWYFVVGTFDKVGSSYDVEIFVNGVSEATASGTGSELTPYTNTCIGGARRYNNAITAVEPCEIHNVRIWDRILTSDQHIKHRQQPFIIITYYEIEDLGGWHEYQWCYKWSCLQFLIRSS
jgi:hypothetical protein